MAACRILCRRVGGYSDTTAEVSRRRRRGIQRAGLRAEQAISQRRIWQNSFSDSGSPSEKRAVLPCFSRNENVPVMLSCKNVKIFPSRKRGLSAMKKRPPETACDTGTGAVSAHKSMPLKTGYPFCGCAPSTGSDPSSVRAALRMASGERWL